MGSDDASKRNDDKPSAGKRVAVGGVKANKAGFQDAAALIEAELAKTALPPPPAPYARHMPQTNHHLAGGDDLPAASPLVPTALESLRVHIGNVHYGACEADVQKAFERFGRVTSVTMRFDPVRMRHRGFAFVAFESPESARLVYGLPAGAISFNGLAIRVTPPVGDAAKPPTSDFAPIDVPVSRIPVHVGEKEKKGAQSLAQRIAEARGLRPAAGTAGGSATDGGGAGGSAAGGAGLALPTPTAIVISNMVRSADEVDQTLVEEITQECSRFGRVLHVSFFSADEKEGPSVAVEFGTKEAATACSQKMHGRLFDGRSLRSSILSRDFYDQIRNA